MNPRILIIEDEPAIREMVGVALTRAGFELTGVGNASEALISISDHMPDLILLDWMLPGTSGLEFARRLKKDDLTKSIPIIMLTARGEEADKITGLDTGADDYITKPFSPRELVARIKAVLRRGAPTSETEIIEAGNLKLDMASHRVTIGNNILDIGPTEYKMLHFFMTHPERVYSRGQLLDRIWGSNVYVEERTVDVHIRRLRKILSQHGYNHFIQTVRGSGYRFSIQG